MMAIEAHYTTALSHSEYAYILLTYYVCYKCVVLTARSNTFISTITIYTLNTISTRSGSPIAVNKLLVTTETSTAPHSWFSLPAVLSVLRQHLNSSGAEKTKIIHYIRPTPLSNQKDDNGVLPSPYDGIKKGEAERRGMAWLQWQCQGLCPPASLLFLCLCVSVCARSVGTGTADPPLTPGGVYRAMEEEK